MPQGLPVPCCPPMAPTAAGRECAVFGVLCPQMGPGRKWGRGGEPVCTETESPPHFQDPVHPFLLLINGSWQSTVPSGVELAGYTLGFKIMSGKFHTNSIFKRRV